MACKLCVNKLQELIALEKEVPGMLIYPLYGAQACDDQAKVFDRPPENVRKLIFSTNIAETGLTIPGIKYVVDSGLQKERSVITSASGSKCLSCFFFLTFSS